MGARQALLTGTRWHLAGLLASAVLCLGGLGALLVPTSVHVDTTYGNDIFFSCGTAATSGRSLFPPADIGEPDSIEPCAEENAQWRRRSIALLAAGVLVGGSLLINHRRTGNRRPPGVQTTHASPPLARP